MSEPANLAQLQERLAFLERALLAGGHQSIAQTALRAKYIAQGYVLFPWEKTLSITHDDDTVFGTTPDTDMSVVFDLPKNIILLEGAYIDQLCTSNTDGDGIPTYWPLPNAGIHHDGNGVQINGLPMRLKAKTDRGGDRSFSDGWKLASQLEGDLYNIWRFREEVELIKSKLTFIIQTMIAKSANKTYQGSITLFGVEAVKLAAGL